MFDNYSKIEDYINNRLSDEDRKAFEVLLESDKDLRKVVDDHKIYSSIADEFINDNLSNKIFGVQNKIKTSETRKTRYSYIIAAAIVIFMLIMLALFFKPRSGENIYAEVYQPPMSTTVRGDGIEAKNNIKPCFLGHQQLDEGKVELAKSSFKASLNDQDLLCKEKSLYYLALINVKEDNFKIAREYISKVLANEDCGYESKAQILLEKIKD